jgi:beta-phosphoglucomutase
MYKGIIFDLDGVIVNTARYHYLAWKRLAGEFGFNFTLEDNEQLKGVNRMRSLDIVLKKGNINLPEARKIELAERKNEQYKKYLTKMDKSEVLPGILNLLKKLHLMDIKIALGTASKNAPYILEKLNLKGYFHVVVDGNSVTKAKPDPEVFLQAAKALELNPQECIVAEDSQAGIEAAKKANMFAIGIGSQDILNASDIVISKTDYLMAVVMRLLN